MPQEIVITCQKFEIINNGKVYPYFLGALDARELQKVSAAPSFRHSESLMLMSKGAAIVIANSSYSWWAAKLSSNGCIIIAPSKWYQGMKDPLDLIPEDWTKIESSWRVI